MSREERVKNKFVGAHVSTCDHKGTFSDKTKNKFLGPHVSTTRGAIFLEILRRH